MVSYAEIIMWIFVHFCEDHSLTLIPRSEQHYEIMWSTSASLNVRIENAPGRRQ